MPLDFLDLDITNGEIAHHEIVNNAVYTWQQNSFQRQYFAETTLVNAQQGSSIVLGTGTQGTITSIGTQAEWYIRYNWYTRFIFFLARHTTFSPT
jgi:preprotein translocase subunit YajC